jgi:aspartate carbamoyltransferase catalytic subunit
MEPKKNLKSLLGMRDVISIKDFSKNEILTILDMTHEMKTQAVDNGALQGKILATCFFEASTRTRFSFEAAMKQLGGGVIGFADGSHSSIAKKETLFDTIKVMGGYADIIVMRHPLEGAARLAAEATNAPIINAGDGANQHPTQTLLDLYTIRETQQKLHELHIAFIGDLKYGRAVNSLITAASIFDMRMYFIIQPGLEVSNQTCDELKRNGILFSFHHSLSEVIHKLDILYMTRLQEERFNEELNPRKFTFTLNKEMLKHVKPNLKILHPLPRVHEIDRSVDQTAYAHYFPQAQNGLYLRKALLKSIIGEN